MRLHVPDHLQKRFQALMNLSYDLKKKRPDLKRNVKFDEDRLDMFMDVQIERDGQWRRIYPDQARTSMKNRERAGPKEIDGDELKGILGDSDQE